MPKVNRNYLSSKSGRRLSRSCVNAWRHGVVRKDDQQRTFSMSSSPRITFQSKIDEKVQGHPPFRCRVGHRVIVQMGLSSVGRGKRETVGPETTARSQKTTHINAIGLSPRARESTIGCFYQTIDRRTLSRPLHG